MKIRKMLPFMESEDILEVARAVLNDEEGVEDISLKDLVSFMDDDDLDEIALDIYCREQSD